MRRQIVHNAHVVADLEAKGAIFVAELSEAPDGATVVLAAHGVSPAVRSDAADRPDLTVIDATCPLVAKVHHEARRYLAQDYQIVLIGHAEHEEVVGTLGEAPGRIRLVQRSDDVADLPFSETDDVAYLTQTTLSIDETAEIIGAMRRRFPRLVGPATNDICYATQNRQDAVRELARRVSSFSSSARPTPPTPSGSSRWAAARVAGPSSSRMPRKFASAGSTT